MIERAGETAKLPFPVHVHMLRHSTGYVPPAVTPAGTVTLNPMGQIRNGARVYARLAAMARAAVAEPSEDSAKASLAANADENAKMTNRIGGHLLIP